MRVRLIFAIAIVVLTGGIAVAAAVVDPARPRAAGATQDVTPTSAHEHADEHEAEHQRHGHDRDYDALLAAATREERAAAEALVDDTRRATAMYADVDAALAAGYRPNPRGGPNATHHPNPALMRDGKVLDPGAPESLLYVTVPGGEKVLVGAVYKTNPREVAPAPGGDVTAWHTHAGDRKCYPVQDATCPQHAGKMLHVFFFDGVRDPFTENVVDAAGGRAALRRALWRAQRPLQTN